MSWCLQCLWYQSYHRTRGAWCRLDVEILMIPAQLWDYNNLPSPSVLLPYGDTGLAPAIPVEVQEDTSATGSAVLVLSPNRRS